MPLIRWFERSEKPVGVQGLVRLPMQIPECQQAGWDATTSTL